MIKQNAVDVRIGSRADPRRGYQAYDFIHYFGVLLRTLTNCPNRITFRSELPEGVRLA